MVRGRQQESEKKSDLASRLRRARELLGITQESLGKIWGKTGNYIYMLEAGIKPVSKKLEHKVIELEEEVRKKLYSPSSPILALHETPAKNPATEKSAAPVVSWASAGVGGNYGDLATQIDEEVLTDCADPNKYALVVEGDSMSPKFEAGDRIIVAPNAIAQNGDVVVARVDKSGEVFLKLYHETQGNVRLTSFNSAYPTLDFRRDDFRFVQPVYALVRKLRAKR
jgi:SOS-response transcriptional repressor LexA